MFTPLSRLWENEKLRSEEIIFKISIVATKPIDDKDVVCASVDVGVISHSLFELVLYPKLHFAEQISEQVVKNTPFVDQL